MKYIKLYEKFDAYAHNTFRKKFSKEFLDKKIIACNERGYEMRKLSPEQKKQVREYWEIPKGEEIDYRTHEIMLSIKDDFDPRYLPEYTFRRYIDPFLSDRRMTWGWDDKNYFDRYLPEVPFPYTYVRNINGYFLNHNYEPISKEEAKKIVAENLPVIIKPTIFSGSGKEIELIESLEEIEEKFDGHIKDYIVQRLVVQCDELKKMSLRCVNIMRIVTAIVEGKPKYMTAVLRCNQSDVIADNIDAENSDGTLFVGITEDGKLNDTGYHVNNRKIKKLISGFEFGGLQIPSYKDAIDVALKAHAQMPMFGVLGWDITIDENNKPLVMEYNLKGIGVYYYQLANGPFFGDDSKYFARIASNNMKKG